MFGDTLAADELTVPTLFFFNHSVGADEYINLYSNEKNYFYVAHFNNGNVRNELFKR